MRYGNVVLFVAHAVTNNSMRLQRCRGAASVINVSEVVVLPGAPSAATNL